MKALRKRRLRVLLVGTEFFRSYGGIQSINRLLVRAFCEMGRRTPMDLEVLSFTDGPEHFPSANCGDSPVRWFGASRRRTAIALEFAKRVSIVRPDLVLFTHVSLLPLAEVMPLLAPGTHIAALAHGTEVWKPLGGKVKRAMPRVDSWVTPSAFTAGKLTEVHSIPKERINVIAHGLDPDWTAEGSAEITANPSPVRTGMSLLSVTRLSRADRQGKGIELVLRALPAVLERHPGVRYTVVGGGADLPAMADLIQKLGLGARATLTGARQLEVLRQAYLESDVFVLPTQVEGFGVVFLEAMYSRLPVVAVQAAATPEVVEDGVTGILVPPGDSSALAAALVALFSNENRRRAMGEAGRRRVERMYCFEHFTQRWELWLASQVPEALYAARQIGIFASMSAAAGAA